MNKLSADELLDRLEWRREIRNVMGNISHDQRRKHLFPGCSDFDREDYPSTGGYGDYEN